MIKALLILLLLFATPAWGAIALVNTPTVTEFTTGGPSLTVSMQCNTGSDFLVVGIASYNTVIANTPVDTTTISSVTYNGVAMTLQTFAGTAQEDVHLFTLVAPATNAAHNLVVNYSPNVPYGGIIQPTCWSGVDQTTPVGQKSDLTNWNPSATSPETFSISMSAGSVATDAFHANTTPTKGASQTLISGPGVNWAGAFSYLSGASAMTWTWTGTVRMAHSVIEIKAAGVATKINGHRVISE